MKRLLDFLVATVALLAHQHALQPTALHRIAADPYERLMLYRDLERTGNIESFPEEYRSHRSIAESLLLEALSDDEEDYEMADTLELVAERETGRGRLFLFKFAYRGEDTIWHAAVSGPQPLERERISSEPLSIAPDYTRLDELEQDEYFNRYLQQLDDVEQHRDKE